MHLRDLSSSHGTWYSFPFQRRLPLSALLLIVAACSDNGSTAGSEQSTVTGSPTAGNSGGSATSGSNTNSASGTSNGNGMNPSSQGGSTGSQGGSMGAQGGTIGANPSGGTGATGGGTSNAGSGATSGAEMNSMAGNSNSDTNNAGGSNAGGETGSMGGAGGASPAGDAGSGGETAGGAGGADQGGMDTPGECTRELLQSTLDAYFEALAAQDPSTLPLADGVKFTENGEEMELGSGGLWTTAGMVKYSQTAFDTEQCMSASDAVVPDGNTDIPLALRLKVDGGKISEIETIAVRSGDYILSSNTNAMISSADTIGWEDPVPEADRATRDELTSWMNKYFRLFPGGVCNTTSDCQRLENGGGDFVCSAGASCSANDPGPNDTNLVPRLILADEERGIGVGFTMFQGQYSDMHMFKMHGGQVYAVHAILGDASSSGWD